MKKRSAFLIVLLVLFGIGIGAFLFFPKSIDSAISRIGSPFAVGELLATQQLDKNFTAVIYTNKEEKDQLQNAIIRKYGIFYDVIDKNGSIEIEQPKELESGELRARVLISWYGQGDRYFVIAAAYDNDVSTITYQNQELIPLNVNGYHLFYGYGVGENTRYELFDKNGNRLAHIKE